MAVEWKLVESSNIVSIGYENHEDDMKAELHVQFKSGAEYVYHDVPQDMVQEFLNADSKGKFLNERIKGLYEFHKLG